MMVPRPYRCAAADAYSLPASGRAGANKMQAGEDEEDNDDDDETVIYGGNDEDEDDGDAGTAAENGSLTAEPLI